MTIFIIQLYLIYFNINNAGLRISGMLFHDYDEKTEIVNSATKSIRTRINYIMICNVIKNSRNRLRVKGD